MKENDYRLISVAGVQVGLVGLEEIFTTLKGRRIEDEETLKNLLLTMVGEKNFIPFSARDKYATALLREFRRFLGEEVDEDKSGILEVLILGPGCYSCDKLEQDMMTVLAELGLTADLRHITDINTFSRYGVMATPALVINGKVKSQGKVPPKSMLIKWLKEEMAQNSIEG